MTTLLAKHDEHSIGLIGHVVIDYPSPELSRQAVAIMVEAGVSLIELQIPFSEPIADGLVFLKANHDAIAAGVTVDDCFAFCEQVCQAYDIPFVFTAYANSVFHQGYRQFIERSIGVGIRGAIIPDLPVDAADDYFALCKQLGFAAVQLIPPNVSEERLKLLCAAADGFIYVVARAGVSGDRTEFSDELSRFVGKIQAQTQVPIAVGFGVKTPEDVAFLRPIADYAIVGTQATVVLLEQGLDGLREFWRAICTDCSNQTNP